MRIREELPLLTLKEILVEVEQESAPHREGQERNVAI